MDRLAPFVLQRPASLAEALALLERDPAARAIAGGTDLVANLLDYRMPTIVESPPIETFIVEAPDPNGPFGAKEAGEGALSGFLPALTNAIADAIGLELDALPASPDRVLAALAERKRAAQRNAAKAARQASAT